MCIQGHGMCAWQSAWQFNCWMCPCMSEYVYSQISIYMQIVHPVSNPHVCLLGVDEMCSMQSSSAHQESAKSSQAESGAVLFHHHPHCGNVKPRGPCQSSQFCYLLGSQPARNQGKGGGGWGGGGLGLLFEERKRKWWQRVRRGGRATEQLLFLSSDSCQGVCRSTKITQIWPVTHLS